MENTQFLRALKGDSYHLSLNGKNAPHYNILLASFQWKKSANHRKKCQLVRPCKLPLFSTISFVIFLLSSVN